MNTKRAEKEIKALIDSGINFDYEIDMNVINKIMFCIQKISRHRVIPVPDTETYKKIFYRHKIR